MEEALTWIMDCEEPISRLYSGTYEIQAMLSRAYAEYYEKTKNYPLAIIHLKKYQEYNTKALFDDREGAINELHIKYETEKNETDLKIKGQDLRNTRILLWIFVVFFGLALFFSIFLYRLYRKNKAISHKNAVLVQEQNHRVKNNLQIVSSLLNLQSNQLTDNFTKNAIEETQMRISSMVHLHRQLYNSEAVNHIDLETFILDITEGVLDTYNLNEIKKNIQMPVISLIADKAIILGLLINELITNASKYAFKEHPNPELTIRITENLSGTLTLQIKDNGFNRINPSEQKTGSFGFKLIQMMTVQLNARSSWNYDKGLQFTLDFNP